MFTYTKLDQKDRSKEKKKRTSCAWNIIYIKITLL